MGLGLQVCDEAYGEEVVLAESQCGKGEQEPYFPKDSDLTARIFSAADLLSQVESVWNVTEGK
jgi:hypothetical protein